MTEDERTIHAVVESFVTNYGFDPGYLYCLNTGKPIGYHFNEDFRDIILSIQGDPESKADDLAMRLLASMRPSMRWNKLGIESLDTLRRTHPHETMAYLLNLLFTPTSVDAHDYVATHCNRVRLYARLCSVPLGADFDSIMLMLLELHSRWNLLKEPAPFKASTIIESITTLPTLLKLLTPYYLSRVDAFRKLEILAMTGPRNAQAHAAFSNLVSQLKPITPEAKAKSEKQASQNFMDSVLQELMGTRRADKPQAQRVDAETVVPVKPAALPSIKMPKRFGVKS